MQNWTWRCIFQTKALAKVSAVVKDTLLTSRNKAAKWGLGKQGTTVFPLPYFWSTFYPPYWEKNENSTSDNISHTILIPWFQIKTRLHLLKQLDMFAFKSWAKQQCRKDANPTIYCNLKEKHLILAAISSGSFIAFQKLSFPAPISPCLSYCPIFLVELFSVSFLIAFIPYWSNLCDNDSPQ